MVGIALGGFLSGAAEKGSEIIEGQRAADARREEMAQAQKSELQNIKQRLDYTQQIETAKETAKRELEISQNQNISLVDDYYARTGDLTGSLTKARELQVPWDANRAKTLGQADPKRSIDFKANQLKYVTELVQSGEITEEDAKSLRESKSSPTINTNVTLAPDGTPTLPIDKESAKKINNLVLEYDSAMQTSQRILDNADAVFKGAQTLEETASTIEGFGSTLSAVFRTEGFAEASKMLSDAAMPTKTREQFLNFQQDKAQLIALAKDTMGLGRLSDKDLQLVLDTLQGSAVPSPTSIRVAMNALRRAMDTRLRAYVPQMMENNLFQPDVLETHKKLFTDMGFLGTVDAPPTTTTTTKENEPYQFTSRDPQQIREELEALPAGASFIDPRDGKVKTKKKKAQ